MDGKMVQFAEGAGGARLGYIVVPEGGVGPALLMLHAWWGLNDFFKSTCDRLAAAGYVVFAPDLFGGKLGNTVEEASHLVETSEGPDTQEAVLEAVRFLARQPGVRPIGIGVVGFSFGAAYALLLSTLRPNTVRSVVVFYGTYVLDFSAANAAYLGHFAEHDQFEPVESVEALKAALEEAGREVTFYVYPSTGHWFFEEDRAEAYRPAAAQLAWERTLAFLATQLAEKEEPLPQSSAELMGRVERSWAELQQAFAGRTPEELTKPGPDGWAVREHLAHVAFWERLMLLGYIGGQPLTEVAGMDEATLASIDAINAAVAARSRSQNLEDVLGESRDVHAAVVSKLARGPFDAWMSQSLPDGPDERPLMLEITSNTSSHYRVHAGYIRTMLAR